MKHKPTKLYVEEELVDVLLVEKARELQDFFLGTYADKAIEAAIETGNNDLIRLAVHEYSSARQLIEDDNE